MNKNVAVISGGFSSEIDISRQSAKTILDNLDTKKWNGYLIEINEEGWFYIANKQKHYIDKNDFSISINNNKINFDIIFITIHGIPGEDGKLQGYFDLIGIPYINSNLYGSALSFNKWACNQFLKNFGVKVANSLFYSNREAIEVDEISNTIGFPCYVKPNGSGSSYGITKVTHKKDLNNALHTAFSEGNEILIESEMKGREISCGVYKGKSGIYSLPITEIITENSFFDFEAKYNGKSKEITPADLSNNIELKIKNTTIKIFNLLRLRGIARADYILINDEPHLIEINTTPGMSKMSIIPQQIEANNQSLTEILTSVLEASFFMC